MLVLSLLLGLEIPAIENIETIFNSMAYNMVAKNTLNNEKFFILHREIEIEHIRSAVCNFVRFQKSELDILNFNKGFNDGIIFWKIFWATIKKTITDFSKQIN